MSESRIFVESREQSVCPICKGSLKYRDRCMRSMKQEGGKICGFYIRRLFCMECHKYHRELPDCLIPYKHYSTEVVSGVLDDIVSVQDEDSEDYPCEMTMRRWCLWLKKNIKKIEEGLREWFHLVFRTEIEASQGCCSLLCWLRNFQVKWLEMILYCIYNSGGYLISS